MLQLFSFHHMLLLLLKFNKKYVAFFQPSVPNDEQVASCPAAYPTGYPPQPSILPTAPPAPPEIETQPIMRSSHVMESQPQNEPPPPYSPQFPEEFPLQDLPPQTN